MGNLHARENRCIHPKTGPDVKGDSFAAVSQERGGKEPSEIRHRRPA